LDWRFLQTIPATRWGHRKVDASDLSVDFYWVDDAHGEDALAVLTLRGKADRAVQTSVDRDPDALLKAMHQLADAIGMPRFSEH
jgi:hypothetical protein